MTDTSSPIGDGYLCSNCKTYVYASHHTCPGPVTSPPWGQQPVPFLPWIYPNRPDTHPILPVSLQKPAGASGWACPVCGSGNAPWVSQCGCQGRTGVSTTTTNPLFDYSKRHDNDCPDPAGYVKLPEVDMLEGCVNCGEEVRGSPTEVILADEDTHEPLEIDLCDECLDIMRQETS